MRPYQAAGVRYLEGKRGRALIADEPGLGKTVQALAYIRRHPELRPVVVVCPAIVREHWRREIAKWLRWEPSAVEVLTGKSSRPLTTRDVYIVNYDVLASWLHRLVPLAPRIVVIDESHYVKNRRAQRAAAVADLVQGAVSVIALTGTLVANRPDEALNQVRLVRPDLFPSWAAFMKRYMGAEKGAYGWKVGQPSHLQELEERLRLHLMVRRQKSQVLAELPELQRVTVPMGVDLADYNEVLGPLLKRLASKALTTGQTIQDLTELRQAAARAKLAGTVEWIADLADAGNPIVVYAHHHWVLDRLAKALGAPCLDGRTPQKQRREHIDLFQAGEVPVMVCGTRAVGVGIDLYRAQDCVTVEFDWSPSAHVQAEARLHRLGQAGSVTSYYVAAIGTIDEAMMAMLDAKQEMAEGVLGTDTPEPRVLATLIDYLTKGGSNGS